MDLYDVIRALREERQRLDRVIAHLESIERDAASVKEPKRRGRKSMDDRARQEVSNRMKRYWASRRASRARGGT